MKTKQLVMAALFIALSFVGANIKLSGSIAFDSLPAFLGTLLMGPIYGAVIGFAGHLLSAGLSAFPLTLPIHLVIAFEMALAMIVFGYTYRLMKNSSGQTVCLTVTGIVGIIMNGPVALAISAIFIGMGAALGLAPILILASALNVILAIALFKALDKVWRKIL